MFDFEKYSELQEKYGSFLCGYARNPQFKSERGIDYVNSQCALHMRNGFICTRRLPMNMLECELYKENQRQRDLRKELSSEEKN
jgi:hypothetical protein